MTDPSNAASGDPELAALWLGALERAVDGSAHGLKNLLNAVAVNLEVVRARAARDGAAAAGIARFAETAAAEFERTAGVAEALVALTRPERGGADVAAIAARLAVLLGAATGAPAITVSRLDDRPTVTGAPASAVRGALASVLQSALSGGGEVTCEVGGADGIFLRVTGAPDVTPSLREPVATILARHGVGVRTTESSVELLFPAPGR